MEIKKKCPRCNEHKLLIEFSKNRSRKHGVSTYCKPCGKRYDKSWRRTDSGRKIVRDAMLKYSYGVTGDQFDALMIAQSGSCAVCNEIPERRLDLDHDHKTGTPRGLLCNRCNQGIGLFRESSELLATAIEYLNKFR